MTTLFEIDTPITSTSARAMGSHQSSRPGTVTWLTPPAVIEALGGAESFDLDPCSIADRPWPTARRHIALPEDGLSAAWEGRVWLNPPYSTDQVVKWLRRMAEHDQGTALIFARTETDSFQAHVWPRASGLLFIRGRLRFHRFDGSLGSGTAGAPSVLCAYGHQDLEQLAESGIPGAFVALRFPRFALVAALDVTWRQAILEHVRAQAGPVSVSDVYRAFLRHPKARLNPNWQAKIRQTLQLAPFARVERGVYALASDPPA